MKKLLISVYIVILTVAMISCVQPVKTFNTMAEAPEEIIMDEFEVMPVPDYPAYYVGPGSQAFGIPSGAETHEDLVKIPCDVKVNGEEGRLSFDSFFVIDGEIFFQVQHTFPGATPEDEPETVIKYCKQSGGEITYLNEADFPATPDPERVTGTEGDHVFDIGDYEGTAYSSAQRGDDPEERIIFIDGYCPVSGGMLIHVRENPHPSRPPGLLFWPDGKNSMTAWKDTGRFWMM